MTRFERSCDSGWLWQLIGGAELIGGLMLASGQFVPLGLAILTPIVVGIFAFGRSPSVRRRQALVFCWPLLTRTCRGIARRISSAVHPDRSERGMTPHGWVAPVRLLLGGIMAWGGAASGYLWREIGAVNIVAGLALMANKGTPLAVAALTPICINVFLFHLWRRDAYGLTIGVPVVALDLLLVFALRAKYLPLLS